MMETFVQGSVAAATFVLSLQLTGDHTPDLPWWRKAAGIGYGVVGLWLAGMLLSAAVPVVRNMHASVVDRGPSHVVLSVFADQRRSKDCRFQFAVAELIYPDGQPMHRTGIAIPDGPDPSAPKKDGMQWLGEWRIMLEFNRPTPSIRVVSHHYCGLLGGDVTTVTGPFFIGAAK